ncbi:HAD family hydrolase [Bacillus solimangrovi]|uniref:HAD family hydrolase n=1 Tax=Bacillus solimangrovi TaxID=1305675 RepID=A0A1E5LFQ2_9BACI|nr:HAD-IA family hydrolase [Bacillus solimangrovi]OEH92901.1 hypothetical protein BFG57_14600 [Bacillus solimangrovi]
MKWDCICFDLDNTLCDYERAFESGMRTNYALFLKKHWKDTSFPTPEEWFPVYKSYCDRYWHKVENESLSKRDYQRKRLVDSLLQFGVEISNESADSFQNSFYKLVDEHVLLFPGIEHLLDELKAYGTKLGIISNGRVDTQKRKIDRLKLFKWFSMDSIIISDEVGVVKPEAKIFQCAEQRLKAEKDRKLFVGDSWELDVCGAINAGWGALYFNTRNKVIKINNPEIDECKTIQELTETIFSR